MASELKNLSVFSTDNLPDISEKHFAILVAEWNSEVTNQLLTGAYQTLLTYGAREECIHIRSVPGSYELSYGAALAAQTSYIDAVICLGCVIQGETKHNDYINHAVAQGLTNVSIQYKKPVIFGVLTPNTLQQALDRSGGIHGNKGDEAAMTAIKMLGIRF
ncbi:MAG: 6,7-dimethyl-8-ribityllumazine synthase [Siphonobacter sp.]